MDLINLQKLLLKRFINTVNTKFKQTGKIREKYDVINPEQKAGEGEYVVSKMVLVGLME